MSERLGIIGKAGVGVAVIASAAACGPEIGKKGVIIGKEHQPGRTYQGTTVKSVNVCDPLPIGIDMGGSGIYCRTEGRDASATFTDGEDYILKLKQCEKLTQCTNNEVVLFTNKSIYDKSIVGDFIDLNNNPHVSTHDSNNKVTLN